MQHLADKELDLGGDQNKAKQRMNEVDTNTNAEMTMLLHTD